MANSKELNEIQHTLERIEDEYAVIVEEIDKKGFTKELARRMLFFVGGTVMMISAENIKEKISKLDATEAQLAKSHFHSILEICAKQKELEDKWTTN